ncbi:MAG: hypothetical protein LBS50_01430 [Prevotellaceae bacterium]|jgi:hypothetical protein|nr:hypothetical protein [Prevotellaceae bacterium]
MQNTDVFEKYGIQEGDTFESRFSTVSLENIYFYVVAFCAWVLERLFNVHKAEVQDYIVRMKPHSAVWYQTKAKEFLLGFDLIEGEDIFDTTGASESDIEAAKIVKYAAVSELQNKLRVKVATVGAGGSLAPITQGQLQSFEFYINKIKDAGTIIELQNTPADSLKIDIVIYYNLLILRPDGTDYNGAPVVANAIKNYIAGIEFDGTFITTKFVDALQQVEGVRYVHINSVQVKYGILPYTALTEGSYRPDSGYMIFDEISSNLIYQPS